MQKDIRVITQENLPLFVELGTAAWPEVTSHSCYQLPFDTI